MILKRTYYLWLLAVSCWLLSACSSEKKSANTKQKQFATKEQYKLPEEVRIKSDRIFIDANKAKILGDFQQAIALFTECLRLDSHNDAAMYELANIFWNNGQKDLALFYSKSAAELKPGNKYYQRLYAESLASNGKFKDAANVYSELIKRNPDDYDYYLDKAYMQIRGNQFDDALQTYEEIEKKVGIDEEIILQKERIFVKLGKIDKAVSELEKLIKELPKEPKYYGMLAELYDANNMPEKAMEQLKKVLEIDPDNPNAYLAIADYYRKKNDRQNYLNALKKVIANPEFDIDIKIRNVLFPYLSLVRDDSLKRSEAFMLADLLVQAHPEAAKAHAMYGDLLFQIDSLEELAREQYRMAIRWDESKFTVWNQLMQIDAFKSRFDTLMQESQQVIDLFPNQIYGYYFNGFAKTQLKKYSEAVKVLGQAVKIETDDRLTRSKSYEMLGDVYYTLKNIPLSDSCYEKSIVILPDNYSVLNNYSYYLSLRGEKLEHAEEMSRRANKLSPDNSAYEDTYAWVLYKLKKYSEAKEWIEKALKHGGEDRPVLLEHYGDILFQIGQVDLAVENWKKAREKGSESTVISRKIADRKLYEDPNVKE